MQAKQSATVRDVPVPNITAHEYLKGERRSVAEADESSEVGRARSITPTMTIRVHHPHPLTRHLLAKGYTKQKLPARQYERETAQAGQVSTLRNQRLAHDKGASVNGLRKRRSVPKAHQLSQSLWKGTSTGGGSVSSRMRNTK